MCFCVVGCREHTQHSTFLWRSEDNLYMLILASLPCLRLGLFAPGLQAHQASVASVAFVASTLTNEWFP